MNLVIYMTFCFGYSKEQISAALRKDNNEA